MNFSKGKCVSIGENYLYDAEPGAAQEGIISGCLTSSAQSAMATKT